MGTISIHTPRVGSDSNGYGADVIAIVISIHTPRVGSDTGAPFVADKLRISIHTPRVGSDLPVSFHQVHYNQFQSTLPVWGVTLSPDTLHLH